MDGFLTPSSFHCSGGVFKMVSRPTGSNDSVLPNPEAYELYHLLNSPDFLSIQTPFSLLQYIYVGVAGLGTHR